MAGDREPPRPGRPRWLGGTGRPAAGVGALRRFVAVARPLGRGALLATGAFSVALLLVFTVVVALRRRLRLVARRRGPAAGQGPR